MTEGDSASRPARTLSEAARDRARDRPGDLTPALPTPLRAAAAWGWRFLVVVAVVGVIGLATWYLAAIVVPVAVALLLAALLSPAVSGLESRRVPRGVATAVVMLGGLALLGGVLTFVVVTLVNGLPGLGAQLSAAADALVDWLSRTGPLRLSEQQLIDARTQLFATLRENQQMITEGALTTAFTIGEVLTESLLVLFALIFFLHGGGQIWQFLLGGVPAEIRTRVDVAGRRGIAALVGYVRATAVVAVVDAVLLGIGLAVLGVPLAVPLAALVFLGAFVPILGAVISGAAAVLVALVVQGPVVALIVLALLIAIMQLESHVLQPFLLGRAVALHPLAVVLAIAGGLVTAGITGAFLAVPLLAVVNAGVRSLRSESDRHADPEHIHGHEVEDATPLGEPEPAAEPVSDPVPEPRSGPEPGPAGA